MSSEGKTDCLAAAPGLQIKVEKYHKENARLKSKVVHICGELERTKGLLGLLRHARKNLERSNTSLEEEVQILKAYNNEQEIKVRYINL